MDVATQPTSAGPTRRIEELGKIILAYSEVTEKLQQSHDRLQQKVQSLHDELGEKNRMLERKNRLAALGEMAAGMAHEIRNPLGGIQLYASLLARDVGDRPQAAQLVQKIVAGVRHLEGLVSQVLQFTREMNAQLQPADLFGVIEEAMGLAAGVLASKRIRPQITGPRPLIVRIDPLLMGQAILNLVINAAHAVGERGEVMIEYSRPKDGSEARQFQLIVLDNGQGIPPQIMDRIFNPFFTTRENGTGLGLAIVHRIVEAHDGAISASNRPGGGARFEIRV